MPQVDFYVTDAAGDARLQLACRVTEKAYLAGLRVLVWCRAEGELGRFDELLWTFADRSFVPHETLVAADAPVAAPVVLSAGIEPASLPDAVLNLDADIPPIALRASRVLEFIDGEATRRTAGRERFRRYRDQGLDPNTHKVGAASL
ncbi:MAG TPA: DNA polymerase III subunit chi [Steroidobacteraceae bacterium]|nr:DNA polymerase III subunit chi [Steroidobacteraceae bacterium]HQW09586.1 DNA polymerase III subunit chi [Steroidobacteraceae bacterium]HQX47738.1 DNA polymerase III subunit chi [Steroidobacteraceae bacterium]HQX78328.1 DNA polymerase III subunit chi [Steroidobacteraceae bacterium]HQZ80786.1 DNA polymerase III subunit chi [Steroidobacteraceae bacterium]